MKILFADDDQDISDYLVNNLAVHGLEIHHLLSGEKVLSYLENNDVDLLLLDWNMPGLSGLQVLEQVRYLYSPSELPVIMVTSLTETERIVHALAKGCNDYITKPVNILTAAARIKAQLSLKKLNEENMTRNKLETLNEVVTTLNHEINSPLFIALNHIRRAIRRNDYSQLSKAEDAIMRITNIVRQIRVVNNQSKEILKRESLKEDLQEAS